MGKILRKYKENIKQGETVVCYCDVCKIKTKHVVVVDHQEYADILYETAKETYDGESCIRDYQIIKCNNCDELFFRIDGWFSEDGSYEELYPESDMNKRPEKEFKNLPYNLADFYPEVIKAYNHNMFILMAVGVRAILEGICKENKIETFVNEKGETVKVQNFFQMTEGLFQKQPFTRPQKEAWNILRKVGNAAVHELFEPTKKESETILDSIEMIIESIYEFPNKVRELKDIKIE